MIVIPDAVEIINPSGATIDLKYANCYQLQNQMLNHCGTYQNRVAILDIAEGYEEQTPGTLSSIDSFRKTVEPSLPKFNSYGAAYYPWLNTTVYQLSDVSYKNIDAASQATLAAILTEDFTDPVTKAVDPKMTPYINALVLPPTVPPATPPAPPATPPAISVDKADSVFSNLSKSYQLLINGIATKLNLMPPSAAIAGIYTTVDNNEGVWIAPANVGVQSVISPSINIDSKSCILNRLFNVY